MIENPEKQIHLNYTPAQEMHRNQLQPLVRSYCDNLGQQINRHVQASGASNFAEFLKGASTGALIEVNQLMNQLEEITVSGEIPFDDSEYYQALDKMAVEFEKVRFSDFFTSLPDTPAMQQFLEEFSDFPATPPAFILAIDPFFMQKSLEHLKPLLSRNFRTAGLLVGLATKKSLEAVSPEEAASITQKIDLSEMPRVCYLGHGLSGGTLEISGLAGDYLGNEMTAGLLIAKSSGGWTGNSMKGGKIRVNQAGRHLGEQMQAGEIEVDICDVAAGLLMKGGKINISEEALNSVGEQMEGGHIMVNKSGFNCGRMMKGGLIEVVEAGNRLGNEMEGGHIKATKAEEMVGWQMVGGKIEVVEAGDSVGEEMEGGEIYVDKAGFRVGQEMKGGTIYIQKDYESVSPINSRRGGDIYHQGRLIKK